jgi:opacity protein-like surface antigen
MPNGRRMVLLAVIAVLVCGVSPASAEWSLDFYGGVSWIQSADIRVGGRDANGNSIDATIFSLKADTGFSLGVRPGYWFDSLPFLGLDLDIFYMHVPISAQTRAATGTFTGKFLGEPISVSASGVANIPDATLPIVGFAPELRLRWPLGVDATYPHGRWQPYLSVGPSWAFSLDNSKVSMQTGGKVGAGLTFRVLPWLALFSEYRFIFYPGFEFTDRNITYKSDFNTHNLVFGVSFGF